MDHQQYHASATGGGSRQMDNDVFRLAVIDHAKALGMDPKTDSQFLWLAEEALLAELPPEWDVYDDNEGNQYFYNHRTGESTWENPLDEPYRKLFQKLKRNPNALADRSPRPKQWGTFPGEERISNRALTAVRQRSKRMADDLGFEEKDLEHDERHRVTSTPPLPPSSSATASNSAKTSYLQGIDDPGSIEAIVDHRTVTLHNFETEMEYKVKRKGAQNAFDSDWYSATVLFSEIPQIVHAYNNEILKRATDSYNKRMDDIKQDFDKKLNTSVGQYQIENQKLKHDMERAKGELENAKTSWDLERNDLKAEVNRLQERVQEQKETLDELSTLRSQEAGKSVAAKMGMESQLRRLREENASLRASLEHVKKAREDEVSQSQETTQLEQQILEWKEKAESLRREKERLTGDRTVFESMLENVKKELDNELASNLSFRQQIAQLETQLEQKSREIQRQNEQIENLQQKDNRQIENMKNERDNARAELELMQQQLLRDNAAEATSPKHNFEGFEQAQQIAIAKVEKSFVDQIASLEAALNRSRKQNSDLEDEIAELNSQIIAVREELGATERKLNRIDNERSVLKGSLENVKKELDEEFAANERLRQELHTANEQNELLQRQQKAHTQSFENEKLKIERERDQLMKKVELLSQEGNDRSALVEQHTQEMEQMKRQIEDGKKEVEEQLENSFQAQNRLMQEKKELDDKIYKIRQQVIKKEEELAQVQAELIKEKELNDSANRLRERGDSERAILESSLESIKAELKHEIEANETLRKQESALRKEFENAVRDAHREEETKWKSESQEWQDKTISLQEQVKVLEDKLVRCKEEMNHAISAYESKSLAEKENLLAQKDNEISQLKQQLNAKPKVDTEEVERLQNELERLRARIRETEEDQDSVENLKAQVKSLKNRCATEIRKRRVLHNKVVDLQGNIRVYCRVRPVLQHERDSGKAGIVVEFPEEGEIELQQSLTCRDQTDAFEFDQVFNPQSSQGEVFEQVEPLALSALDGYNVCIFAYGQTGSGKTYTMDGTSEDRGVNHRTFETLFEGIREREKTGGAKYTVSLSVLEIYNETIRDLLEDKKPTSPNNKTKKLEVRQGEFGLYVPGLTEETVGNAHDIHNLMTRGIKNRTVGTHNINAHSSRSHLVVTINLVAEYKRKDRKVTTRSKLHLIDLAGSERLDKTNASGSVLEEAKSINKSLSALGNVIKALGRDSNGSSSSHVPFRDSKLTYLLQDSLSGSSKVLMFVNISPVEWNAAESLCSLTFAQRCRKVALGKAKKNTESAQIAALRRTIDDLNARLKQQR